MTPHGPGNDSSSLASIREQDCQAVFCQVGGYVLPFRAGVYKVNGAVEVLPVSTYSYHPFRAGAYKE